MHILRCIHIFFFLEHGKWCILLIFKSNIERKLFIRILCFIRKKKRSISYRQKKCVQKSSHLFFDFQFFIKIRRSITICSAEVNNLYFSIRVLEKCIMPAFLIEARQIKESRRGISFPYLSEIMLRFRNAFCKFIFQCLKNLFLSCQNRSPTNFSTISSASPINSSSRSFMAFRYICFPGTHPTTAPVLLGLALCSSFFGTFIGPPRTNLCPFSTRCACGAIFALLRTAAYPPPLPISSVTPSIKRPVTSFVVAEIFCSTFRCIFSPAFSTSSRLASGNFFNIASNALSKSFKLCSILISPFRNIRNSFDFQILISVHHIVNGRNVIEIPSKQDSVFFRQVTASGIPDHKFNSPFHAVFLCFPVFLSMQTVYLRPHFFKGQKRNFCIPVNPLRFCQTLDFDTVSQFSWLHSAPPPYKMMRQYWLMIADAAGLIFGVFPDVRMV
nr:MAG TPA: hypothetical protein [Caudoviricetes sp.]